MSRPSDAQNAYEDDRPVENPRLGPVEWLRWVWRQLTSMRTALLLLLALAVAAVPGSIIPQNSADPNGVALWRATNPVGAKVIDALQGFDVYSSAWFSAIYLLLFISLVGCVVPRVRHHLTAARARPPRTPSRFDRLPVRSSERVAGAVAPILDAAEALLKRKRYRTTRYGTSVSAERGYLRETGNLVFHAALLGILVSVFVGGGFTYTAQKLLVTGQTFVNGEAAYDSFNPGRFVGPGSVSGYALTLDHLAVEYQDNLHRPGLGEPLDYTATVTSQEPGGAARRGTVKVNAPLDVSGTAVYLLGNGYAAHLVVTNPDGSTAYDRLVPFQPQDANLTSLGVVKVKNTAGPNIGLQGFLFPTDGSVNGTRRSIYPGLNHVALSLNVWKGTIGDADPSVYVLDTSRMTKVAGQDTDRPGIELTYSNPTQTLPDGLGTITLKGITRYAAFDIHHDPSQGWVALFVGLAVAGLITSLLVPRRRLWVKVSEEGDALLVEYAGLARGDDPGLERAVADLRAEHRVRSAAAATSR